MADAINSKYNLTLNWTPPIHISNLIHQGKEERGVYVWGFTINGSFTPYYVGIADDIRARIHKHIRCILSGEYTIYHADSLTNFKEFKTEPANANKMGGKLYEPDLANGFNNFINNRKLLQPHIDFMVSTFTFMFANVNKEVSGQDLKEIEKICINKIGKGNLANTRMGNSDKYYINHYGCELFN